MEGIAALFGSKNGSRYRGVSQLQSHQSRYSVQLRTRVKPVVICHEGQQLRKGCHCNRNGTGQHVHVDTDAKLSGPPATQLSSRNKLPFMILSPPEQAAETMGFSCRKMHFPPRKMHFPAEKCIFLQKNAFSPEKIALSCRKMHFPAEKKDFPAEKCGFGGGTWQETAGNCRRVSGLKNQEH